MSKSRNAQDELDSKLVDATKAGNLNAVEQAIGPEVAQLKPSQKALDRALSYAYRLNHFEMMALLIFNGANPDVTFPNIINRSIDGTLLHHAAYYQQTEKVAFLLRHTKNIDAVNNEGKTAFHYAIEENNGNFDICELLIDQNAKENHKEKNTKGYTPSSQIGMILKLGRIEIAKLLFAKRPNALPEFQRIHPNIISYVCSSPDADHDVREAMLYFLLTDVPSLNVTASDIQTMIEKNYHAELLPLCIERMRLNEFWLSCQSDRGGKIKKQLSDAIFAYKEGSPFNNKPNALLANDIWLIMQDRHPVISHKRFLQIFHDSLAFFITPPNGKLCRNMTFMLYGACEYLLNSRRKETHETKVLCQLTLLTALHTIANSSEDTYSVIVKLMQARLPETHDFAGSKYGEKLLIQFIEHYPNEVRELVRELKEFYVRELGIRLTATQVNPCSAIETLLNEHQISRYREDADYYNQTALQAVAEQEEIEKECEHLHDHISTLKMEIAYIRAEKDQIADSFTDAHKWKMKAQQTNHALQQDYASAREENEALQKLNQELQERVHRLESERMAANIIETAKARAIADPESVSSSPVKLKQRRVKPSAKPAKEKKRRAKRVVEVAEEAEIPYVPAPVEREEAIAGKPMFYPPKKIKQSPAPSPEAPSLPVADREHTEQRVTVIRVKRARASTAGLFSAPESTSKDAAKAPQKRK